jgi:hypothetical protein
MSISVTLTWMAGAGRRTAAAWAPPRLAAWLGLEMSRRRWRCRGMDVGGLGAWLSGWRCRRRRRGRWSLGGLGAWLPPGALESGDVARRRLEPGVWRWSVSASCVAWRDRVTVSP